MTTLVRLDPFLGDLFNTFRLPVGFRRSGFDSLQLDLQENDKEYLVRADLPGVRKEDAHVSVDGRLVTISAERKQEQDAKDNRYWRKECAYGKISRSLELPQEIDQESSTATMNDGVLEVRLVKSTANGSKTIAVN